MHDFLRNLDFFRTDSNALVSTIFIIWAVIFGLILAFVLLFYKRRVIGSFVRAIRKAEAIDISTAKTLAELEQSDNISAVNTLKKSDSMRQLVTVCNEGATDEKGRPVIDENTRFFISTDKEERARKQYGDEEEPIWPIILATVVLVALGVISFFFV